MENIEIFIYLAIIAFYFLFNYVVNNMLGKKKEESGKPQPEQETFDPWDPFGDYEEPQPETSGQREKERMSRGDLKPEERTDLGEESTVMPEQKSTFPPPSSRSDDAYPTEQPHSFDFDPGKIYQEKKDPQPAKHSAKVHRQAATELTAPKPVKRRKKFKFDPVQAVIYSEILKRPEH